MINNNNNDSFMNEDVNSSFGYATKLDNTSANPMMATSLGCGLFIYSLMIIGFLVISFSVSSTSTNELMDYNSFAIIKTAFRYTIYETVIIILPFIIVKKICPNAFAVQHGGIGALLLGLLIFIALMTTANKGWVILFNSFLDNSKGSKYYIKITQKYEGYERKGKHQTRKIYCIRFDSWKTNKHKNLEVFSSDYNKFHEGQICTINSYKGYYGFEYVNSATLKGVDESRFPENTKFPLTQEEAEKIMASNESQPKENNEK